MNSLSYSALKPAAEDALREARYSPRRLVLIHTGVTMSVGLLLSILTYLLDMGIAQTGGLSGIQTRAMLESMQSVVSMASLIALPFWEIGFLAVAFRFARRQELQTGTLLGGFRHFGPVLRGMILKGVVVFVVMFVAVQVLTTIYMFTPAAAPLYDITMEQEIIDPIALMENEEYMAILMDAVPLMLIGVLILELPVLYFLRFTDYVLMDRPERGALFAVFTSFRLTWKNLKAVLKLDLHFWWFYGLEVLIAAVSYGHQLLDIAGAELDTNGDTMVFAFYILSMVCQLGLYAWKKNDVFTTYALAYDVMMQPPADLQTQPDNI